MGWKLEAASQKELLISTSLHSHPSFCFALTCPRLFFFHKWTKMFICSSTTVSMVGLFILNTFLKKNKNWKTLSKWTHQNLEFIHILMKNDKESFILVADTGDGLLDVSDYCAFQPLLMSVWLSVLEHSFVHYKNIICICLIVWQWAVEWMTEGQTSATKQILHWTVWLLWSRIYWE